MAGQGGQLELLLKITLERLGRGIGGERHGGWESRKDGEGRGRQSEDLGLPTVCTGAAAGSVLDFAALFGCPCDQVWAGLNLRRGWGFRVSSGLCREAKPPVQ